MASLPTYPGRVTSPAFRFKKSKRRFGSLSLFAGAGSPSAIQPFIHSFLTRSLVPHRLGTLPRALPLLLLLEGLPAFQDHLIELVHALGEALADDGARRLDVVGGGRDELVQRQLLLDLGHGQRLGQVLLVGDDEQRRALVLGELGHLVQLRLGLLQPVHVHRVHHVDDAVRAAAVRLPQRPQLLLAAHVPEVAADALGRAVAQLDLLRVEADGGHRVHELVELEPVEHRGLAGRVQTQHDDVQGLEGRDVGRDVAHGSSLRRRPLRLRREGAAPRAVTGPTRLGAPGPRLPPSASPGRTARRAQTPRPPRPRRPGIASLGGLLSPVKPPPLPRREMLAPGALPRPRLALRLFGPRPRAPAAARALRG